MRVNKIIGAVLVAMLLPMGAAWAEEQRRTDQSLTRAGAWRSEFGIPIIKDFPVYTFKDSIESGYLF